MTETPKRYSDDMISGAFAGASARLVTAPFDVLKIRFQLQFAEKVKYTSITQAFSTVIKEEGIFGLWKGNIAATYLWISYATIQFGMYGLLKDTLQGLPEPSFLKKSLPQKNDILYNKNGNFNSKEYNKDILAHEQGNISSTGNKVWKAFILFLAGAGAGLTATATTRTQFAIQGKEKTFTSMRQFISYTIKNKGPAGFYAGMTPALVGITPYMGLNFAIYESVKTFSESPFFNKSKILKNANNRGNNTNGFVGTSSSSSSKSNGNSVSGEEAGAMATLFRKGVCGAIAGGTSKFIVYPLDTLKKRMQVQVLRNTLTGVGSVPQYNNVWHCISKTFAEEGIRGFYKGLIPTTVKSIVATAVTFAAYEAAKDFLICQRKLKDKKGQNI